METVRKGSKGASVIQLQEFLKKEGYTVQPDGDFGEKTHVAVCRFQQKNGLTADGVVGQKTWDIISKREAERAKESAKPIAPVTSTIPEILKKGSKGTNVVQLQELLKKEGYAVQPDGDFGEKTHVAVCQFQQRNGLSADGVVGQKTWDALAGKTDKAIDFAKVAAFLNIEEAAIRAVCEVESGGRSGFLDDGRPMILFEGHILWSELKKRNINPEMYQAAYSDVLYPKWDRAKYKGGAAEYSRLEKASKINKDAALCSASWGMFQIMGFNHKLCGYDTVSQYVDDMKANATNHLLAFAHFIKNSGIDKPLRALNWAEFAKKYNGPDYKLNQYDTKLQKAYLKYK